MVDIFEEVGEDVRREQLLKLWKRYGRFIITVVVLIVLGTLGIVYWRQQASERRQALTSELVAAQALGEKGQFKEAGVAFAALRAKASGDMGAIAGLLQAQMLLKQEEIAQAVEIYRQIVGDGEVTQEWRDLAGLLAAHHSKAAPAELEAPATPGRPLAFSVREWRAWQLWEEGKKEEALAALRMLKDDAAAPASLRERAGQALTHLEAGAAKKDMKE